MVKLNLGCGNKLKEGYVNIDAYPQNENVLKIDLEKDKLKQFNDNTINEIYSSHFLEHVNPLEYLPLLKDMYRASKHGAIWHFKLPFYNAGGMCNPAHFRTYYFDSFKRFKPNYENEYHGITLVQINKSPNFIIRALSQIFPFMYSEIEFKLRVIKKGD